jgi:hypothetical protein
MVKAFKRRAGRRGSLLALVAVLSAAVFALVSYVVYHLNVHAIQTNHLLWRDPLYRMANEGYVHTHAQIGVDPSLRAFDATEKTGQWGVYRSSAVRIAELPAGTLRDLPELSNAIYLVVSATLTAAGNIEPRGINLSVIFTIADAGRFFAASQTRMDVSASANISADIFGRDVTMYWDSVTNSKPHVGRVYYTENATLKDLGSPPPYNPQMLTSAVDYPEFVTSDGGGGQGRVNKLAFDPIFPSVGPGNLAFYKAIASAGANNSTFTGSTVFPDDIRSQKAWASGWPATDIYPPGCPNAACGGLSDVDLKNHVYYVEGNLSIKGRVFGQVLFVATGTITVDGDVVSDGLTFLPSNATRDPEHPDIDYPGCPAPCHADRGLNAKPNSSNAHQAVLITPSPNGIVINNLNPDSSIDTALPPGYTGNPLTVEAFFLIPRGGRTLKSSVAAQPFDYTGALILGDRVKWSNSAGGLTYPPGQGSDYMSSLAARPPPYIPGFTELQLWQEDYF